MLRRTLIVFALLLAAAVAATPASAFWTGLSEQRHGTTGAEAATALRGSTPTLSKSASASVRLTWTQSTLSNGQAASGYVVTRFDKTTGATSAPVTGCSGTVTTLTCTELGVPTGEWQYTVTPLFGANWKGAESAKSAAVATAPGVLALNTTLIGGTVKPLPATVTGSVSGFGANEPIEKYVLDAATQLTGAPLQVGANGSATITSLAIPAGTLDGVHTVRVVGSQGSEASLPITIDNAAPSGGSVDAANLSGTGNRYSSTTNLSIAFSPGTDPGAGLATTGAKLFRATATLTSDGTSDGACGSFGAFTQVGANDPASPRAETVTDKACYRYRYVVLDNLGNQATYTSPDVKVDQTPPPAPTVSFSALNNVFWSGTGTTIFFKPSATSGSFKLTANDNDNVVGIASFSFQSLGTGWTSAQNASNVITWSWSAANPSEPGAKAVTATNNAGRSASANFTTTADGAGPAGGSVTYTNGNISTTTTSVSFANGTDTGSGVNAGSGILQRASAPVQAGGACGTFGNFVTVATGAASPFSDNGLEDGKCYQYRYLVSDNLGNQVTYTSANVLKVQVAPTNTTLPTIAGTPQEGVKLTANNGSWTGTGDTFTYQWRSCDSGGVNCVNITGATNQEYTPVSADVGRTLRVVVTATNPSGSASATSAQSAGVIFAAPVNQGVPVITGSAQVGQVLHATEGDWTGGGLTFSFEWRRCDSNGNNCANLNVSPTLREYTVQQADVGFTIRVAVTATNNGGTATAVSVPTGEVGAQAPVNKTLPVITSPTSPPKEGQELHTSDGTWENTGGTITFSYQWLRCNTEGNQCANIGTNSATYILQSADVGKTIRVTVTATDSHGSTPATSVKTGTIVFATPVNTALPTITGTPEVAQTLTAHEGTWTGGGITFSFQWLRCDGNGNNCGNISGATSNTYVPTDEDASTHTLRVRVTATNSGGSASTNSVQTEVIKRVAPVNTALPTISGIARENETLTTSDGIWTGSGITFTYHWSRCNTAGGACVQISGTAAEKKTYVVTAADVGSTLRSVVTASNTGHSVPATSAQTAIVTVAAPVNTALPSIPGTPKEGTLVTATTGTWSGTNITFTFQWRRCDTAGNNCASIAGATAQSYTPVAADVGGTLRIAVTATNAGGSTTATSNQSATVVAAAPTNLTAPTISGTAKVNSTLTATEGTWTGIVTEFKFQWRRCDGNGNNCENITGAEARTYVPTNADIVGSHRLRVTVTAINSGGSASKESAPTEVVVA
jgi:hypothetical protein